VSLAGGGSRYDYVIDGSPVHAYMAPPGFDPLMATDAQLDAYGLPPRPADANALRDWTQQMSHMHMVQPPPFLVELPNVRADTIYATNWSGYMVTGPAATFTHAETWYVEPTFYSSVCSSNAEVTWAGLGGWNSQNLAQNGTLHNVPGANDHQAWWEILPGYVVPVNFYAHRGYEFDASTRRISGGFRFYFYDYYNGAVTAYDAISNSWDGTSAEAIAERPTINGAFANLSNFETLHFFSAKANGAGMANWSASGGRHGIHMLNNAETYELALPNTIASDSSFDDTQLHCR